MRLTFKSKTGAQRKLPSPIMWVGLTPSNEGLATFRELPNPSSFRGALSYLGAFELISCFTAVSVFWTQNETLIL